MALKLLVFGVGSLGLFYLTRHSLRRRGAHGFYRFFAWEAVLALVLLNLEFWFHDPLSPLQIGSWILLMISLVLVVTSVKGLVQRGRPDGSRTDPALMGFERTTALVTTGVYRYFRHPLYSSLLYLAWGILFKDLSWAALGLAVVATIFLFLTARAEEAENLRYFGAAYGDYMQHTKRFIPGIW